MHHFVLNDKVETEMDAKLEETLDLYLIDTVKEVGDGQLQITMHSNGPQIETTVTELKSFIDSGEYSKTAAMIVNVSRLESLLNK